MSSTITVSFRPVRSETALVRRRQNRDEPLVFRSSAAGPYDQLLNLDGLIMLDLLNGAVEQVEIWDFETRATRAPANDAEPLFRMFLQAKDPEEAEREVLIDDKRQQLDRLFLIEGAAPAAERYALGGGLSALVADGALCGFQISNFFLEIGQP